jgi:hypothetical protein
MTMKPYTPYFIIKVPKDQQRERREKIGSIFLPPNFVWMRRNMQCGEVVGIGSDAAAVFPEVNMGDILVVHHFAEGQATGSTKNSSEYLVYSDDQYNHYLVTGMEFNGRRNETYAVWDGKTLIPHRDFLFVEIEKEPETDLNIEVGLKGIGIFSPNIALTTTDSGLITTKKIKPSREKMTEMMQKNVARIQELSNNQRRMTTEVISEIKKLEMENNFISKEINKKRYDAFTLAYCNPEFGANPGDVVYCLNIAAQTKIEFMNKEYIVVNTQYSFKKFWNVILK